MSDLFVITILILSVENLVLCLGICKKKTSFVEKMSSISQVILVCYCFTTLFSKVYPSGFACVSYFALGAQKFLDNLFCF